MSELFGSAEAGDYSLADLDDLSQAQTTFNTGSDEQAQSNISSVLANVGNRSNIRGSKNYDPLYAQAFNMSRGLQPGNLVAGDYYGANKFQGIADLARPSYLQPQVQGKDGTMYFSQGERFLQETLPSVVQGIRKVSPTGILQNLINYGTEKFKETFGDDKKSDAGIMETIDRADLPDYTKAMLAGMENTNRTPATQTAFDMRDARNFLTSPAVLGRAVDYFSPQLQQIFPEGTVIDTSPKRNQEGDFMQNIEVRVPLQDFGLGSLFRNLG